MRKIKTKSLRAIKNAAWKLFSEYVRRKYADSNGFARCYTCGEAAPWKELQCGHAIPGRANAVLFDDDICRPQCVRDNVFMRGRYEIFAAKLIRENGLEWFEQKLAQARQVVKLNRADLKELITTYKAKLETLDGTT